MIVDFALAAVTQAAVIYVDHAYYKHLQGPPQPVPDGNVADALGPVIGVAIVAPILELIPIAFTASGIRGATHICPR